MTQATTTTSFLQEIEADAIAAVNAVKADIAALWNKEAPVFEAELKSLEQTLLGIAANGVVTILQGVASGTIQSKESLGALVTHTYQNAIAQGVSVTISDAQAAARQVAAATSIMMATTAP